MTYWTAGYTEPQSEYKARESIELLDRGAFLPTMVKTHVFRGRLRQTEHPILKRYVLIALESAEDEAWSAANHITGIHHVLTNNSKPGRVSELEIAGLMLAHATGAHNITTARTAAGRFAKRRRRRARPRKGKKARSSTYIVGEQSNGIRHAS